MSTASSARLLTANYSKSFDEDDGHLMTVEEYLQDVASGGLMDDDGMGDVVRDGLYAEPADGADGWPQWLRRSEGATYRPQDNTVTLAQTEVDVIETVTLWRRVAPKELELIRLAGMKVFLPRVPD